MVIYQTVWLVALGVVAALLVHEGGHVLAALATGQVPRVLTLGRGPLIARCRFGTLAVALRAVPVTGYVLIEPGDRRWAYAAMVAAGPAANLLAFTAAVWAQGRWPDSTAPPAIMVYQGLYAAMALLPRRGRVAGIALASDGLQLYRLARAPAWAPLSTAYAGLMAAVEPAGSPARAPTPPAAALCFALARPDQYADPWARGEIVASLRALLAGGGLVPRERAIVLCCLCGYAFVYGEGLAEAAELVAWSEEAVASMGGPVTLDARGCALLLAGKFEEAEAALRSALDGYAGRREGEGLGAALCRATLARTVGLLGRADESRDLWRAVEAEPAVANPLARALVTRIRSRAVPTGGRTFTPS